MDPSDEAWDEAACRKKREEQINRNQSGVVRPTFLGSIIAVLGAEVYQSHFEESITIYTRTLRYDPVWSGRSLEN